MEKGNRRIAGWAEAKIGREEGRCKLNSVTEEVITTGTCHPCDVGSLREKSST